MSGFPFAIDIAGPMARGAQLGLQRQSLDLRNEQVLAQQQAQTERLEQARRALEETIRYHDQIDASRQAMTQAKIDADQEREDARQAKIDAAMEQKNGLADMAESAGFFGQPDPNWQQQQQTPAPFMLPDESQAPRVGGQMTREQFMAMPVAQSSAMLRKHVEAQRKQEAVRGALTRMFGPDSPVIEQVLNGSEAKAAGLSPNDMMAYSGGAFQTPQFQRQGEQFNQRMDMQGERLALAREREANLQAHRQFVQSNKEKLSYADKEILDEAEKELASLRQRYSSLGISSEGKPDVEAAQEKVMLLIQQIQKRFPGVLPDVRPNPAPKEPAVGSTGQTGAGSSRPVVKPEANAAAKGANEINPPGIMSSVWQGVKSGLTMGGSNLIPQGAQPAPQQQQSAEQAAAAFMQEFAKQYGRPPTKEEFRAHMTAAHR